MTLCKRECSYEDPVLCICVQLLLEENNLFKA